MNKLSGVIWKSKQSAKNMCATAFPGAGKLIIVKEISISTILMIKAALCWIG
jgi:hypothetical protein